MTDTEFADYEILAKSRAIQGANETVVRAELAARGLAGSDLDRVIATADFRQQNDLRDRHRYFRLKGAVALVIGIVWLTYLLMGPGWLHGYSEVATGMIIFGVWFVVLGENGAFGRLPRRKMSP